MSTSLEAAVNNYVVSRNLSQGTKDEYKPTLRKWKTWGCDFAIEELSRTNIREFIDWVYEQAVEECGSNPGRTANKAR